MFFVLVVRSCGGVPSAISWFGVFWPAEGQAVVLSVGQEDRLPAICGRFRLAGKALPASRVDGGAGFRSEIIFVRSLTESSRLVLRDRALSVSGAPRSGRCRNTFVLRRIAPPWEVDAVPSSSPPDFEDRLRR